MKKQVREMLDKLWQDEDIAIIRKYVLAPSYWIKKINMLFWMYLHILTRHKVARSFGDLFYSPNGYDLHTVIVILGLFSVILGFFDDARMFREMAISMINLVKETLEEIWNLECEYSELEDNVIN